MIRERPNFRTHFINSLIHAVCYNKCMTYVKYGRNTGIQATASINPNEMPSFILIFLKLIYLLFFFMLSTSTIFGLDWIFGLFSRVVLFGALRGDSPESFGSEPKVTHQNFQVLPKSWWHTSSLIYYILAQTVTFIIRCPFFANESSRR